MTSRGADKGAQRGGEVAKMKGEDGLSASDRCMSCVVSHCRVHSRVGPGRVLRRPDCRPDLPAAAAAGRDRSGAACHRRSPCCDAAFHRLPLPFTSSTPPTSPVHCLSLCFHCLSLPLTAFHCACTASPCAFTAFPRCSQLLRCMARTSRWTSRSGQPPAGCATKEITHR